MGRGGLLTHAELDAAGVPRSTVRDRCHLGAYQRVLPGVFATQPLDHLGLCRAVALWRPDAVISHASAAALWGTGPTPDTVTATVSRAVRLRTPEWLTLHRRTLTAGAVTTGWGLRLVTPERALVDCLVTERGDNADLLVDDVLAGKLNPRMVAQRAEADAGSWGGARHPAAAAALAGAGGVRAGAATWPSSASAGSAPGDQSRVLGYRVDFLHRPTSTVVEVDGRAFHSEPAVFVRDRVRQNAVLRAGLMVLRYAAVLVLDDVEAVATEVCTVLDERADRRAWPR